MCQTSMESNKRPNSELTPQEKEAKRNLKRKLKQQYRRRKLETRLRQAISRKDADLQLATRREIETLLRDCDDIDSQHEEESELTIRLSRPWIESIYHQLQSQFEQEDRDFRASQARELFYNMTKGTQTREMFDNETALRGYTRYKFIPRAVLVADSLARLPKNSNFACQLNKVKTICSVGCGPGCDAIGALAYGKTLECPFHCDRVLLLDWAILHWNSILEPLKRCLSFSEDWFTEQCDITEDLSNPLNFKASGLLAAVEGSPMLVLMSYILSETRGKWYSFVDALVDSTAPGTLFLWTDPTAWQLHIVIERCNGQLDFMWLDSSRNHPELQPLEGRLGPAVLLGKKRAC